MISIATKIRFNKYILKYKQIIPLDNIDEMKRIIETMPVDCELVRMQEVDLSAHYLCQDVIAGRNKERAMQSAVDNYPEVPRERMLLFDVSDPSLPLAGLREGLAVASPWAD